MSKKSILIMTVALCLIVVAVAILINSDFLDKNMANGFTENSKPNSEGYPRTVTDFYGAKITLENKPQRVVAQDIEYLGYLGRDVLDSVVWAGKPMGSSPTGKGMVEIYDFENVCTMSGMMITMAEQIIAKEPDLVIISDSRNTAADREEFRKLVEAAGINVYFYTNQSNLFSNSKECLEVNLSPIAEIFAKEERARYLIDLVDNGTARLYELLQNADTSTPKNVYVAGGAGKSRPNFLGSSPATYHPMLYLDDYAHNVMYEITDKEYITMEFETLYDYEKNMADIDTIFINIAAWNNFHDLWTNDSSKFKALKPFQTGEVYVVTDWFPRAYMCLGCAYLLAEELYPEAFENFDANTYIRTLMNEFYGSEVNGSAIYESVIQYMQDTTGQNVELFGMVNLSDI